MKHKAPNIPQVRGLEARSALTAKKLLREPLYGAIGSSPNIGESYLDLAIGVENYICGDLKEQHDKKIVTINQLYVSRLLRGKGIGERLMRCFVAEAKHQGAQELWSDNVSNMALGLRARIFGADAMTFYDSDHPEFGFLPISLEQAMDTNDRMIDAWNSDEDEIPPGDIGAYVNLDLIDTSDWLRPDHLEKVDLGLITA